MFLIISPAKTLDFSPTYWELQSRPALWQETDKLLPLLKKLKTEDLRSLMDLSEKLAEENYRRFQEFKTKGQEGKQAILAFKGDVYKGLEVDDFSAEDLSFAQGHLRILSGLYGLLAPSDLIQPHRLEMGTSLENNRGKNHNWWRF